ncbi:MAG: nucleotidyltransferase domain-containing protein [Ruminococcaceae bacterium]|jgi:predicted nucleotidyltransferase|nr:nucleotidyltransferase domain-containing protein [Oscillospiraceae bacterium]
METQKERNRKIIRAVIEKAQRDCPGSLALVGVNGSFATGQAHARSDLDLLIVVNDGAGDCLAAAFVQKDMQAAHDLYCMSWDRLRQMARYENPHIAKLMDARIVWSAGKEADDTLGEIRAEARTRLSSPFGAEDFEKAKKYLSEAEHCFAMAYSADSLSNVRRWSTGMISSVEDGLTMLNKRYYRLGVKARYEELEALERKPDNLCALIEEVAAARDTEAVRKASAELLKAVTAVFRKTGESFAAPKMAPDPEDLAGTWEEMYSNWRGKMHLAAETGDRHLALESLESFGWMLTEEVGGEYRIGEYDIMAVYDPDDLRKTEAGFDALLCRYREECRSAGVKLREYEDTDAFVRDYLRAPDAGSDQ